MPRTGWDKKDGGDEFLVRCKEARRKFDAVIPALVEEPPLYAIRSWLGDGLGLVSWVNELVLLLVALPHISALHVYNDQHLAMANV